MLPKLLQRLFLLILLSPLVLITAFKKRVSNIAIEHTSTLVDKPKLEFEIMVIDTKVLQQLLSDATVDSILFQHVQPKEENYQGRDNHGKPNKQRHKYRLIAYIHFRNKVQWQIVPLFLNDSRTYKPVFISISNPALPSEGLTSTFANMVLKRSDIQESKINQSNNFLILYPQVYDTNYVNYCAFYSTDLEPVKQGLVTCPSETQEHSHFTITPLTVRFINPSPPA